MEANFQFIFLAFVVGVVTSHEIRVVNHCHFTVWPGVGVNPGYVIPANGGFKLDPGHSKSFQVGHKWEGRVWGRTKCDAHGHCETGDCNHQIGCRVWGAWPASLAEFKFDGWHDQDYYDISLVDGFNLPLKIEPIPGTFHKASNSHYDCNAVVCKADINGQCPHELQVKAGGHTVGCKSGCAEFRTPEYCCTGHYDRQHCGKTHWKVDYPGFFKHRCPDAYSFAYDDATSTFACRASGGHTSGYIVTFCP